MTREEKNIWTKNATPEELLETYVSMIQNNSYGCYTEDIEIVKAEMVKRMSREAEAEQTEETLTEETLTENRDDEVDLKDREYIESYKISINGSSIIKRRETLKGALSQMEKLISRGKHGTVEAVIGTEAGIRFEIIKKF